MIPPETFFITKLRCSIHRRVFYHHLNFRNNLQSFRIKNDHSVSSSSPNQNNLTDEPIIFDNYHKTMHCDAFGVQLTASVSMINSGLGFPGVADPPSEATTRSTLSRTVYVVPGFKSSILACILLFLFLDTSLAFIVLLFPSISHF